jgi:L-iditol 2-dehydrogenase
MKAAVLTDLKKLELQDVPTPEVDDDSVLVRVRSCLVCGSDIRILNYGNPRVKPPQIMGHEIAGDVAEVGRNVTKFAVGDRVAIAADVPCGECPACEAGYGNNCKTNLAMGYQFPGGFAEYVLLEPAVVRFGPVHRVPDELSYDVGALAEPLACAINGFELVGINPAETVVVIGAGPIGCMLIEYGRLLGAGKTILVQRSKARLEIAKRFGADAHICTLEEDPVERVLEETGGDGADVIFTACSSPEAQEQAVQMLNFRGRLNLFGGLPPGSRHIDFDSNFVHYREAMVTGSHGSVPRHHALALRLLASGTIDGERYFTHRFPLDEVLQAFEVAAAKDALKVAVNP